MKDRERERKMERIQNEQPHGDGNALKKIDPSKTFVVLFKVLLFDHKTKNVRAHRSFVFTLMCVCVATRAFFVVDATSSIFIFFF